MQPDQQHRRYFPGSPVCRRKTLLNAEHPLLGKIAMPAIVPRLSETAGKIEWLGRDLGADTDAVLARTLNYSLARLAELRDRGVI